ncbi:MAG: HD domain-containing protein [Eubacterium sp.]|nr:HD domain-containing protein [Eubacterium sp.]
MGQVGELFDGFSNNLSVEGIISIGLLELSMILTIIYVAKWQKNYGVYYTVIYTIIPVAMIGQMVLTTADSIDEAFLGQKLIYLGGCFLSFFITMAICDICNINVKKWIKVLLILINMHLYMIVLTTEYTKLFYKEISFEKINNTVILNKVYGPYHSVFMILVFAYFFWGIITVLYALFFKKNVSNKRAIVLMLMEFICLSAFITGKRISLNLDLGTSSYIIPQIVFLFVVRRISIFSIKETIADSLASKEDEGFISFDKKFRYIGSIGIAEKVYPWLMDVQVDRKIVKNPLFQEPILAMLKYYKNNGTCYTKTEEIGDRIFKLEVGTLFNGKRKAGYQIHITDDTYDQKMIKYLDNYNETLKKEVDAKTRDILRMHDNLVLSMAMMVESRDNSTGGHIRRTSDCVRIIVDQMRTDPECELDDKFYTNIVKAAPMHDLGKIAVRDSILQKPGRFEPWEYEEMKKHAAEGARIVHEILKNTDDNDFHILAENVAHYHHEKWDGSGYPDGLSGEDIPIEARIMAIADVYDALVSKRVYKERMSFEKADSIIMEGMGQHFDPSLEKYYVAVRPRLEEYYLAQDEEETKADISEEKTDETADGEKGSSDTINTNEADSNEG